MTRTPTPAGTLRTLVSAMPALGGSAATDWQRIASAAFAAGAAEVGIAGRAVFVFAQPLDALRFVLDLPQEVECCRVALHVGELQLQPVDPAFVARGARSPDADSPGFELLERLLAACAPGQRLLSRPAAALLRRAVQGQPVAMPDGWDVRIGDGADAFLAVSLDLPPDQPDGATAPSGNSRQPLPSRPHWWLELSLPAAGPLQRALLRNHKSGVRALLQVAVDAPGRERLREQRAAQRVPAVAALALEPGDGELDALPAFLVGELGSLRTLPEWWAEQTSPAADDRLRLPLAIADALAICHAHDCVHGDFDLHALALATGARIRLWGVRRVDDAAQRMQLQAADCAALAQLLYGLLAGDPQRVLHPFWQREVQPPAARRIIERCLDPGDPEPIRDMEVLRDALQTFVYGDADAAATDTAPRRRWWAPRVRR